MLLLFNVLLNRSECSISKMLQCSLNIVPCVIAKNASFFFCIRAVLQSEGEKQMPHRKGSYRCLQAVCEPSCWQSVSWSNDIVTLFLHQLRKMMRTEGRDRGNRTCVRGRKVRNGWVGDQFRLTYESIQIFLLILHSWSGGQSHPLSTCPQSIKQ